MINEELKEIAKKYDCTYKEESDTCNLGFNIRNLPMKKVILQKESIDFQLWASCEFIWGTSQKPSYFSGNNPDKYTCSIQCFISNNHIIPEFHILENDFVRRFFHGSNIGVYCKDKQFRQYLRNHKSVREIFEPAKTAPELSPVVECNLRGDSIEIDINYQSYNLNLEIMKNGIELCLDLQNRNLSSEP